MGLGSRIKSWFSKPKKPDTAVGADRPTLPGGSSGGDAIKVVDSSKGSEPATKVTVTGGAFGGSGPTTITYYRGSSGGGSSSSGGGSISGGAGGYSDTSTVNRLPTTPVIGTKVDPISNQLTSNKLTSTPITSSYDPATSSLLPGNEKLQERSTLAGGSMFYSMFKDRNQNKYRENKPSVSFNINKKTVVPFDEAMGVSSRNSYATSLKENSPYITTDKDKFGLTLIKLWL